MNKEIETRFLEIDKQDLIKKLKSLEAIDYGETMINDLIFQDKDLNWLNENKLVKLRRKGDKVMLSFKHNKEQKVDSTNEIEFEISNLEHGKIFLEAIGLIQYRIVEKYRHSFLLDGVQIDIDTWPKIPVYVELEGKSVTDLKKVAKKLDLKWEDRFDGDPRFVYKKYGFDFDNINIVTFDKFQ